ncbi:hypothetical protein GCM10022212_16300 [Actimicrobium antarcticum]|uniref:Uncharacterized protein n=1 Tax=Actimicrobium antarcticum TaxID=1051899 RepID=A0ABP7T3G3_9BURK
MKARGMFRPGFDDASQCPKALHSFFTLYPEADEAANGNSMVRKRVNSEPGIRQHFPLPCQLLRDISSRAPERRPVPK